MKTKTGKVDAFQCFTLLYISATYSEGRGTQSEKQIQNGNIPSHLILTFTLSHSYQGEKQKRQQDTRACSPYI